MERIDQELEVLGRAIAAGGRVEARYLVAPGRVIRVLGDGHEFHVREAHLLDVLDQWFGHVAVSRRFALALLPPGTQVDLVNAQRRPQRITLPPLCQPRFVRPLELAGVPHDGRVLGRRLEEEAARIGLHDDPVVQVAHLELVLRPLAHSRNKDLPHPGQPQRTHLVAMPIPFIEVANHADALRVGRPHSEAGAGHAVNRPQLGPQLVVNAALVPLPEEEQIRLAQGRQERVRIARPADPALLVRDEQFVGINAVRLGRDALEEAGLMQPRQFEGWLVLLVNRLNLNPGGIRDQRPHHHTSAVGHWMHPQ